MPRCFKAFDWETAAHIKKVCAAIKEAHAIVLARPEAADPVWRNAMLAQIPTIAGVAKQYRVSPATIQRIARGQSYKDCEYKARLAPWIYSQED